MLTQAGAVPRRRNGLAYFGPTGVQEQGAGTRGSLGNLRDPAVSVVTAGLESRLTNSRLIHSSVPSWWGRTGDERWYRQAKETKCGEMSGRESERSIVTLRRGNLTEGPRGVKGTPFQLTVGGKHGGCIGTRGRVHETTTDSGSRRLKRGAVCVNCASTDLWGAWVGDHPGLPGGTDCEANRWKKTVFGSWHLFGSPSDRDWFSFIENRRTRKNRIGEGLRKDQGINPTRSRAGRCFDGPSRVPDRSRPGSDRRRPLPPSPRLRRSGLAPLPAGGWR